MNRNYLQHDYYTDIITFDYSELPQVSGDLFISVDMIRHNATLHNVSFIDELHRVMIHGVLHLIGLKDKKKADQIRMRKAEDQALALRPSSLSAV